MGEKKEERLIHEPPIQKMSWISNPLSLSLNFVILQRPSWPKTRTTIAKYTHESIINIVNILEVKITCFFIYFFNLS